ncbi:unnamed protein product, partial [Mesorhabditis spiculigera]
MAPSDMGPADLEHIAAYFSETRAALGMKKKKSTGPEHYRNDVVPPELRRAEALGKVRSASTNTMATVNLRVRDHFDETGPAYQRVTTDDAAQRDALELAEIRWFQKSELQESAMLSDPQDSKIESEELPIEEHWTPLEKIAVKSVDDAAQEIWDGERALRDERRELAELRKRRREALNESEAYFARLAEVCPNLATRARALLDRRN